MIGFGCDRPSAMGNVIGSVCLYVSVCSEVGAIEVQIKEAAKARRKRAAMPVVGDMSAMMESLPTFDLLLDRATVQSRLHRQ